MAPYAALDARPLAAKVFMGEPLSRLGRLAVKAAGEQRVLDRVSQTITTGRLIVPFLWIWLLVAPMLLGLIDLMRTPSARAA